VEHCKPVRVLLCEGSSMSARETVSALGPLGYELAICDPNPMCLTRFSKFVRKYHRCPSLGRDPLGYRDFILNLLAKEDYDVLLPVHEQAFLFARISKSLRGKVGLAITAFDRFRMLQSKVLFLKLLEQLSIPFPQTSFYRSGEELAKHTAFPCYIKTDYGTASSGVWKVENHRELTRVVSILKSRSVFNGRNSVIAQKAAPGRFEIVYACFDQGTLIAAHACQRLMEGARGSSSVKVGVDRPIVTRHLQEIGNFLAWHGSLALDYFYDEASDTPYYIDASPRLVEPMNAVINGINIPEVQVMLSLAQGYGQPNHCSKHLKTHMTMLSLLGLAERGASRRELLHEFISAIFKRGIYSNSVEELSSTKIDILSMVPLLFVFIQLLLNPGLAVSMSEKAVADYALTESSMSIIEGLD